MLTKKQCAFWLLILVSLTLIWCGTIPDTAQQWADTAVVAENTQPQPWGERPPRWWWTPPPVDLDKNTKLIEDRKAVAQEAELAEGEGWTVEVTSSEVLYAAKVWDSIEAHPAWLTVGVTLDGETITSLDITQQSSSPKSARHQAQFADQIEAQVVGKPLSESDDMYLSVASSTSRAFNDAIKEIQQIVNEWQS